MPPPGSPMPSVRSGEALLGTDGKARQSATLAALEQKAANDLKPIRWAMVRRCRRDRGRALKPRLHASSGASAAYAQPPIPMAARARPEPGRTSFSAGLCE
jgi:hypothetical protein